MTCKSIEVCCVGHKSRGFVIPKGNFSKNFIFEMVISQRVHLIESVIHLHQRNYFLKVIQKITV